MELIPDNDPKFSLKLPATLDLSACTKKNIGNIASLIINGVKEGNLDAMEEYSKAKGLELLSETIVKGMKENVVRQMAGAKKTEHKGVEFLMKAGASKYDFSDNPDWVKYDDEIKSLTEKKKELEGLMKKAMDFAGVVDESGVIIPPARIVGGSEDSLTVTIPKE